MARQSNRSMPSPLDHSTRWLTRVAVLTGFGMVLFLFESFVPRPLPWIKPGLANIATMIALYSLGSAAAWTVALMRCVLASLIGGTMMNPSFWLSLCGGAASVLTMAIVRRWGRRIFSVIGVGLFGALAHLLAQLGAAGALIVGNATILILLPSMLLSSALTGLIVGYASHLILARIAPQPKTPRQVHVDWRAGDKSP